MADLLFIGSVDPWAHNNFTSPDPVTAGDTSWTWDVEFAPTSPPSSAYARSSINSFDVFGGGSTYIFSGIVQWRERTASGADIVYPVGQSEPSGVADFIYGFNADSVTFGWGIGVSDGECNGNINLEIWQES